MHCGLKLQSKKQLTYVTIGLFNLLTGIEFAVILPTVWLYLDNYFHAPQYFLGFVISSFCLADALVAPAIGRLSDYTHDTKTILIVCNIVQTVGSLLYFMGLNPWFLVGGRFIAGVGNSVSATLLADIGRVTTHEERTSAISMFSAMRQFGLIVGPGCSIFLSRMNFNIGPFPVNKYSSPGLFMAVVWMLHEILSIFCFWNLPAIHLQEQLERAEADERTQRSMSESQPTGVTVDTDESDAVEQNSIPTFSAIVSTPPRAADWSLSVAPARRCMQRTGSHRITSTRSSLSSANDIIEEAEQFMSEDLTSADDDMLSDRFRRPSWTRDTSSPISQSSKRRNGFCGHASNKRPSAACEAEASGVCGISAENGITDQVFEDQLTSGGFLCQNHIDEFIKDEIFAVLAVLFLSYFNQYVFMTIVTPLTLMFLHWGEYQNGLLFCAIGGEIIVVLFGINLFSRRLSDYALVLVGQFIHVSTLAFFLWFLSNNRPDHHSLNTPALLTAILIGLLGLPLIYVSCISIVSKITHSDMQGFAQGLCRIFTSLGLIFGPLWAGCMLKWPYWMFGTELVLTVVLTIPLLLLHARLRLTSPPSVQSQQQGNPDILVDESTPLLV